MGSGEGEMGGVGESVFSVGATGWGKGPDTTGGILGRGSLLSLSLAAPTCLTRPLQDGAGSRREEKSVLRLFVS